ncbi:MAG: twin-arginine translocase TatA/TatE family subunit [Myxococcota bacterium]
MFNLGLTEILIIVIVAVVVVGPERLPNVVRWLGRQYGKLMRASDELRRAFVMEADRADAEARAEQLKKRREEARQRIAQARMEVDGPQPRNLNSPSPKETFPTHEEKEEKDEQGSPTVGETE